MRLALYSLRPALLSLQREILEEFNSTACLDLEIESYNNYQALLQDAAQLPFDILLFDTENGTDTENKLLRLVQIIPNCRLILLSESERHAVFGYSLRAVGYLTTPLDQEEYLSLLICLIREYTQCGKRFLPLKINGVWSQLNMDHITYVESAGHSLLFHLSDRRELKVLAGFKDFQRLLELCPDFFRCHKSYKEWSLTAFTLHDGKKINISRPYRQTARCIYACYMTKLRNAPEAENVSSLAGAV